MSADDELKRELSAAAGFLVPLAQAHIERGQWPIEVAAWLIMVRDSLGQREVAETH